MYHMHLCVYMVGVFLSGLKTLTCNPHTITFTILKYTVQGFLVYSQGFNHYHYLEFQNISLPQKETTCPSTLNVIPFN